MSQNTFLCKYNFNLYEFLKRKITHLSRKTQKQMFLLVSGGHIFAPERDTIRAFSIESFINLGEMFFRLSRIWNIAQTWFLARLFRYLSSFISQILDCLYWKVSIFIFDGVLAKTTNKDMIDWFDWFDNWSLGGN